MRIIRGMRDGGVSEEGVVDKGAFKAEMNKSIVGLPNEQDAKFARGGGGEQANGE